MTIKDFIELARNEGLMTIMKPYGIEAGEYTLMFENAYGDVYEEPKLFKGNEEVKSNG